jgi:hypothetical protein
MISPPIRMMGEMGGDFVLEELRKLGNLEVAFLKDRLPECFKNNGGLAAVKAPPGKLSLETQGKKVTTKGTLVEIKLEITPEDAARLRELIPDLRNDNGELILQGTRKGIAETLTQLLGMRGFNTFLGKPVTNEILTAIAHAMNDLEKENGRDDVAELRIYPLGGGYLQYWLNIPPDKVTKDMIMNAIRKRIRADVIPDNTYINMNIEPSLVMLDATDMDLSETRSRFIVESLQLGDSYGIEILERSNFMINAIENVYPNIMRKIFSELAHTKNGGNPVTDKDYANLKMIEKVCDLRRTIRDTEDLVWTLRLDKELPSEIQSRNGDLVKWWLDFSMARYDKTFLLLTRRIYQEMQLLSTRS